MSFEISNYTNWATAVAANDLLKGRVWQRGVQIDAARKNALSELVGDGEKTMMPVRRVTDLTKGGAEQVIMTTTATIGGQGQLNITELRDKTAKLRYNTWTIEVDLLRNAIATTQIEKLLRFPGNTIESLTMEIMGQWHGKKDEDDIQVCGRRTAVLLAPGTNHFFGGDATALSGLESADYMTTDILEKGKGLLIALGAKEMGMEKDVSGSEIPKFLAFGPDQVMKRLRAQQTFLQALREADTRGPQNRLFTGKYGLWDNMAVYVQNVTIDTSSGRLGTPLLPIAFLGTAIADGTPTTLTGGGDYLPAATGAENDFFANFPGYLWKFTDGETAPADSGADSGSGSAKHYAMIYNLTGADAGKYEIVGYTTGNNGNTITSVTRGSTTQTGGANGGGNVTAQAASRFTLAHPSGSVILQCTREGVLFGRALFIGGAGIGWAKGSEDAEPIVDYVDHHKVGQPQKAHINSYGLQSVRGFGCQKDTNGRYPGIACATVSVLSPFPGVTPEPYVAT